MAAETILNRKALRDFHILERYEAGLELKGSEVKSIRAGKANINDAFARIENGEAFLYNADIQPYERASHEIPSAKRVRKLLLHRATFPCATAISAFSFPFFQCKLRSTRARPPTWVSP